MRLAHVPFQSAGAARRDGDEVATAEHDSAVEVAIVIDDHACLIEVGNRGGTPDGGELTAELPSPLTVGGRGLPLIAALADTAAFVDGQPGHVLLRMTKRLHRGTTESDPALVSLHDRRELHVPHAPAPRTAL